MCGIAGYIAREDNPDHNTLATLQRMCNVIAHRGPDDEGIAVKGKAALGMRRLAIIDLVTGKQPMFSEDGSLVIVFNGEIYNYREIKADLERLGHTFRTNSDTETILRAFEEFGPKCLEHLRGMFAFAIWDQKDKSLFIARDRVGKKPLFYSFSSNGDLVFGSEIKSLLEHGHIGTELDVKALNSYITLGYVPESQCIFRNIKKLPPGHYLVFRQNNLNIEQYWDFQFNSDANRSSLEDWSHELKEQIREAVNVRLISDVPLGAFLSGGIDSSIVIESMSKLSNAPVKTFSIGFDEDSFNELKYAEIAAKRYGTDHHTFYVTPEMVEKVDDLVWHFDEPFGDPSALPTYFLSLLARDHVTVALSGDGGDELFAGYTRYEDFLSKRSLRRMIRPFRNVVRSLSLSVPHGFRGRRFMYNLSLDPIESYADSVSHFTFAQRKELYTSDFLQTVNGDLEKNAEFERIVKDSAVNNDLERLLYLDSKTYLPSDILTKVDRMSMAVSLETRAPLLDHKLIEFVGKIPSDLKYRNGETKYILKKTFKDVVPDEILFRRKQGFGLPISHWINQQLRDHIIDILSDPRTIQRGYFEQGFIKMLLQEHFDKRRDHSYSIWMLFVLELWLRRYLDNRR